MHGNSHYRNEFFGKILVFLSLATLIVGWSALFAYDSLAGIGSLLIVFYCVLAFKRPFWFTCAFVFTLGLRELFNLPITSGGFQLSTAILLSVFSIWAIKALLYGDRHLLVIPFTRLPHILLITFLLTMCVSLMNSHDIVGSLSRIQQFTYCIAVFVLIVSTLKDRRQFQILLALVAIVGAAVACLGIVELITGKVVYEYFNYHSLLGGEIGPRTIEELKPYRIDGVVGDPDYHAMFVVQGFFFSLYFFNTLKSRFWRTLIGIVLLIYLVNLVGTGSRGGVIAFLISFVAYFAFARIPNKLLVLTGFLGTLFVTGLLVSLFATYADVDRFLLKDRKALGSIDLRKTQIAIGLSMFKDHPIIGNGPDGYIQNYHRHMGYVSLHAPKIHVRRLLNTYLQVLIEYGLLGLAQFLLIILISLSNLYPQVRYSFGEYNTAAVILFAVLCGHAFFSATGNDLMNQDFWKLIAFSALLKEFSSENYDIQLKGGELAHGGVQ